MGFIYAEGHDPHDAGGSLDPDATEIARARAELADLQAQIAAQKELLRKTNAELTLARLKLGE
ncbi:MAG: hypothetical protein ACREDA_06275 [Methylocella sp.]